MLTAIFGLFLTIDRVQKVGLMRMRDKIRAENGGVQAFGEPSTVTCHIMAGIKKTHGIVVIYINACKHIDLIKRPFFPSRILRAKNFTNCYSDQSSISNN
jgi:hypothetical protein